MGGQVVSCARAKEKQMTEIVLEHHLSDGSRYQASFLPDVGMNLVSFKRNDVEIIDQNTKNLFEERSSGLGPLIGPHFHRRKSEIIPKLENESLFPHIERCRAKKIEDPFSHGIARYAPWKIISSSENQIVAQLLGKEEWNGVPLSKIEGQNFAMKMTAALGKWGLMLELSVVSDTDSLVGIHYYYHLPAGNNRIRSHVQKRCWKEGQLIDIPPEWGYEEGKLDFELNQGADYTFSCAPDPLRGDIWLETKAYRLRTLYACNCQENAWQLYHPKGASFVCIEPVSAQDPRHPNLTVSSLSIQLHVECL
jgi:hypothetical protein